MKIIACYSNKGGVGKTATAVNLAYACAQSGYQTLLCDLDPQGAASFYYRIKPSKKLLEQAFFEDVKKFTRAIRASDYENLDLVPANMTFRDFDIFLARMKNSRSRLKKALSSVNKDYDVIILDCPPNLSLLSENIFKVSHHIVVPVIPTTLSQRTYTQLVEFFSVHKLKKQKLMPFFSMVQSQKKMHRDVMLEMKKSDKKFLSSLINFSSDIENMGIHRAPLLDYAPNKAVSKSYKKLWKEVSQKIKD